MVKEKDACTQTSVIGTQTQLLNQNCKLKHLDAFIISGKYVISRWK